MVIIPITCTTESNKIGTSTLYKGEPCTQFDDRPPKAGQIEDTHHNDATPPSKMNAHLEKHTNFFLTRWPFVEDACMFWHKGKQNLMPKCKIYCG